MVFRRLNKRFRTNESGQIAIATALLAVPMLLVTSIAIDSNRSHSHRVKLQSALDSAALAAVADQTLTESERNADAEERFWANISREQDVKFAASSPKSSRVDVEAKMMIPTIFAGLIGRESVEFSASASAEITKGSTVCMLALDPDSNRAFEVTTGASLQANCTVQVNSLSKVASVVDHGGTATAKSFCVGGNASGKHSPFVNTECSTLSDPYANLEIPKTNLPCENFTELTALLNDWRSARNAVDVHNSGQEAAAEQAKEFGYDFVPNFVEKNHLKPGNYCRGIYFSANELILDPGEYHITGGDLFMYRGTKLTGTGVTFILHGDARLVIGDGSDLNIAGPIEGPLDGLVFAQNLSDKSIFNPTYPNVTTTITSGSVLNVLGTVYLPSHKIQFEAGVESNTHAPATSFIAHQISLADAANLTVSVDHEAAGISPIKPRSDEGVRLVK